MVWFPWALNGLSWVALSSLSGHERPLQFPDAHKIKKGLFNALLFSQISEYISHTYVRDRTHLSEIHSKVLSSTSYNH
jgi:hypothetical protein